MSPYYQDDHREELTELILEVAENSISTIYSDTARRIAEEITDAGYCKVTQ